MSDANPSFNSFRARPPTLSSVARPLPDMAVEELPRVQYKAKVTPYVLFICIMAGSGGLMYGYDLVIAGGISIMDDFLLYFYPSVYKHKQNTKEDNYCKYNNQVFQLFSSSLYLAALLSSFLAPSVSRKFGRRGTMLSAGILFIAGTVLATSAQNLEMLIIGRALLGFGLGFANQAVPIYLSEIAPPNLRGGLNLLFAVYLTVGIFLGNMVNYLAAKIHPWGWRLSLGLAGVPAVLLTVSSLLIVETPSSLVERGHYEEAKIVLRKIRASEEVDAEMDELLRMNEAVHAVRNPLRELLARRKRPQLVLACAFPFFQQLAGNDAILFYGPFLFKMAGFKDQAALYSSVITGSAAFLTCCVTTFVVDKAGRRWLLLVGAAFMCAALVVIASIFGTKLPGHTQKLPRGDGMVEVVMLCVFVVAFGMSLGPLGWLIPSEILSQEVRSAGQGVAVSVNMVFKFVIAQTFLSMLCAFKFAIFVFFAGWVVVMGVFTVLLVPESKGIPLHKMPALWQSHWFWRRLVQ